MNPNVKDHLLSGVTGAFGVMTVGALGTTILGSCLFAAGVLYGVPLVIGVGFVTAAVSGVSAAITGTVAFFSNRATQKNRAFSMVAGAVIGFAGMTPSVDYVPSPEMLPKAPTLTTSFSGAGKQAAPEKAVFIPSVKSNSLRV